ncbi:hypothetical protein C8A05DRAFT_19581, partial [Staphylotrichum tortipilum]
KWIKHPDVELDHEVADFYIEFMVWVRTRRASRKLSHYSEVPEPLSWPNLPSHVQYHGDNVGSRRREGRPYLEWRRPASSQVDRSQRLLATGRYADEEEADQEAAREALGCYNTEVRSWEAKRKQGAGKAAANSQAKRRSSRRPRPAALPAKE